MLSFLYLTSYLLRNNNRSCLTSQNPEFVEQFEEKNWCLSSFFRVLWNIVMSIEEKFQAALKVIKSLPEEGPYQPSNGTKLKFYSLYKQATIGQCNEPKPGFWNAIARAKWEAWNRLGQMQKEEAMNTYIEELKKIVETMSFNGDVQDFLDSIGPFYEFISLNSPEMDGLKEVVDRLTSSSGSSNSTTSVSGSSGSSSANNSLPSTPETTPQDTPAKEALPKAQTINVPSPPDNNTIIVTETTKTNHTHSNGHIPNQKSSQNHLDTFQLAPGTIPPPTPVHKPNSNNDTAATRCSIEELENQDETLELEVNKNDDDNADDVGSTVVIVSHRPTSASESSDQYFSGDSEVEEEEDESDMVLMKSILPTITVSSTTSPDATREKSKQNGNLVTTTTNGAVRKYKSKHAANNVNNVARPFDDHVHVVAAQQRNKDSVAILQGTVDRLNRDIDHVLARLRILEAAYAANPGGSTAILTNGNNNNAQNVNKNRRVRPFRELSTSTWALIFTWPIAVHFLIKLISWWIERRRRNRSRPLLALR